MKKFVVSLLSIAFHLTAFCQSTIDWSSDYILQLSDFQSTQTEINEKLNSYSIYSGANTDFSFQMSSYEFMFTKNFNDKVKCIFNKNMAIIIAPDSLVAQQLVQFGQYDFDLTELFCRKFRKELYEQKGAFSDVNFFQPIFNKLQVEKNEISGRVLKETDLGRNELLLQNEHKEILTQIESLSDFCKDCKPPKKKRNNKRS